MIQWSVIIPSFGRSERLNRSLPAVLKASAQLDAEVIVVDDGSPEPIQVPQAEGLRLARQSNGGPASARNYGASLAGAEKIAFLDDDCEPDTEWLSRLDQGLSAWPDHIVGGKTVNGLKKSVLADTSQVVTNCLTELLAATDGTTGFLPSCNMAMRKSLFEELGGFDTRFKLAAGEDRDFCIRAAKTGYLCRQIDDAFVQHYHQLDFMSFLKQHRNYGSGAAVLRSIHGASAKLGKGVALSFLMHAARRRSGLSPLLSVATMAVAQAATCYGLFGSPRQPITANRS